MSDAIVTPSCEIRTLRFPAGNVVLDGELVLPAGATGIVLFAHGSGSSRSSPRNRYVARSMHAAGIATLLFDLLTAYEDRHPEARFDIGLLTARLVASTEWLTREPSTAGLARGYFGASTGAAAALTAAASLGHAFAPSCRAAEGPILRASTCSAKSSHRRCS